MKKFKSGFTLAEVLITLGIIGVIAAIVMPTVMTNHTYKTVGVKLQKMASQLESSARPYVVSNTNFTGSADVADFMLNSFIITNNDEIGDPEEKDCSANKLEDGKWSMADECGSSTEKEHKVYTFVKDTMPATLSAQNDYNFPSGDDVVVLHLKDGTEILGYMIGEGDYPSTNDSQINVAQVGEVVFGVAFAPRVNGLPTKIAQPTYRFVVTELGYVYPDRRDDCMRLIADNDYAVKGTYYAEDAACHTATTNEDL